RYRRRDRAGRFRAGPRDRDERAARRGRQVPDRAHDRGRRAREGAVNTGRRRARRAGKKRARRGLNERNEEMIVRDLAKEKDTRRNVHSDGWNSVRLLLKG